jgi:hypothetical protein
MPPISKQCVPSSDTRTFLISDIGKNDGNGFRTRFSLNAGLHVSADPKGKIRK